MGYYTERPEPTEAVKICTLFLNEKSCLFKAQSLQIVRVPQFGLPPFDLLQFGLPPFDLHQF